MAEATTKPKRGDLSDPAIWREYRSRAAWERHRYGTLGAASRPRTVALTPAQEAELVAKYAAPKGRGRA